MGFKAKELKSLSRGDLLELLLAQTERAEELERNITELREQVETKDILINQSGTLAEASLAINQVFRAADQAAAQYLSNVMRIYDELVEKNTKLEEACARKAAILSDDGTDVEDLLEQIREEESASAAQPATRESAETLQETAAKCEEMLKEATAKRDAMLHEAAEACDEMLRETKANCAAMTEETQMQCATAVLESQNRCHEIEQASKQTCTEMETKAKEAADAYWNETYAKIKRYVASRGELKDLLLTKR